jgi:hypothetical protein
VFDRELVSELFDARRKIAAWKIEYNEERPHSSLGYRTPKEFAAAQAAGFYTAEREARDSNAVPCPSRSPIPAQSGDGTEQVCRILTRTKAGGRSAQGAFLKRLGIESEIIQ